MSEVLKGGESFDRAHSEKLFELGKDNSPEGRKKTAEFCFFLAGIVDSVFHDLKRANPKVVEGMKGFGIPK